jgi:hypothetical protein
VSAPDYRHALRDLVRAGEVAQAVELARALPSLQPTLSEAIRELANPERPADLLGAVVDGDALHRELVRYALFCARSVEHLWWEADRPVLTRCLGTVDRWLVGEATAEECQRAAEAAHGSGAAYAAYAAADSDAAANAAAYAANAAAYAAADAANAAADAAANAAADAAANAASRTAQRRYLADRVAAYLRGEA